MAMENNIENKARFFAMYFGQEIRVWEGMPFNKSFISSSSLSHESVGNSFLELKPISSISDEDFNKLLKSDKYIIQSVSNQFGVSTVYLKWNSDDYVGDFGYSSYSLCDNEFNQLQIDFLRSKSYAIPFNGLSVEELINRGWIKLKTI